MSLTPNETTLPAKKPGQRPIKRAKVPSALTKYDAAAIFRTMVRMRHVETVLAQAWHDGVLPGEYHSAIGEEALWAGVLAHLGPDDAIAATHRSTPPFVHRGVDIEGIIRDCLGDASGPSRGMAGHMHLFAPEARITSDGIVGSSGPFAVGQAIAIARQRPGSVAMAWHGEGAMNQGMLMESYTMAAAWGLPVVFILSDNDWSITTPTAEQFGGTPTSRAAGCGLSTATVDGSDAKAVYEQAGKLIAAARKGKPGFLHAKTFRPAGHFEGDPLGRMANQPLQSVRDFGPGIMRGVLGRGPVSRRPAAIGELLGRAISSRKDLRGNEPDPLEVQSRRLRPDYVSEILAEERPPIDMAMARVRADIAGRTTNGATVFGTDLQRAAGPSLPAPLADRLEQQITAENADIAAIDTASKGDQ